MRYIILFICIFFLVLSKENTKNRKIFIILSAIPLIYFSTFRGHICDGIYKGGDYDSYLSWFQSIEYLEITIKNDILFNLLMLVIYRTTQSFEVFIFITSLLGIYSIYKFSLDNTKSYIFTIFLFITFGIYELGLSAIRQFIALSIFLLSFKYIEKKDLFKYSVGIIVASLFHSSAIILFFIYPFVNLKFKLKTKFLILVFISIVFTYIVKIGLYENILIEYVDNYAQKYSNIGSELNSNYTIFIISLVVLFISISFEGVRVNLVNSQNTCFMYLVLLILFSYLATLHPTLGRTTQYFMPAITLILPKELKYIKNIDIAKVGFVLVIVFFSLIYVF